jgi:CRP/FNR family transcriptional regulator, cyclic AMP receptor protein
VRTESYARARPLGGGYVRILDVDRALGDCVPAALAGSVRRRLVAELLLVPARGGVPAASTAAFGLLLVDGVLVRSAALGVRRTVELLGAGDVVRPWQDDGRGAAMPGWTALVPSAAAVLDDDFVAVTARFPGIVEELLARATARSDRLAERLAIASIPSLPRRVLALLWYLADRWGVVTRDGVLIRLPLSHQLLADLACAQRPSVSVALKQLVVAGRAVRHPGGEWVLLGDEPL